MPPFNPLHPVTFAQGRRGEVYAYQGLGNRGQVYSASYGWRSVGLDAPTVAPTITQSAGVKYYIARIDLLSNGFGYKSPPAVTISGGSPTVAAKALSRIREGSVSAIEVSDYGKGYSSVPTVTIGAAPAVLLGANPVTPAALTSNTDDWNPGAGHVVNVSATSAVNLTGVVRGLPGQAIVLYNSGSHNITLVHQSTASSAANRFENWPPQNLVLEPGWSASLLYYPGMARWTTTILTDRDPAPAGTARALPIVRAHLRGKYQCYYRYVDPAVPEAEGGPLYSSLSPVKEVDCGDGKDSISWTYTAPPAGKHVELWRTTSNQATTLFRVARITTGFGSYTDSLTDWELLDPERGKGTAGTDDDYQAMPILLPNGELNANRFGVPPDNYAVGVLFQDRMWMAVDTGGSDPNTLRYSEADEPESMPDVNELILQSNLRATDYITALVPFAGALLVMQSRHCHRLMYVSQPLLDAQTYLLAYRGCLNQRCWDIFEGRVYAMDDQGVYSIEPNGQVENLTLGLYDIWRDRIDYSLRKWFTVRADKRNALLRVCVALKGDGSTKFPTRMFVYSFDYKAWWEERYPDELTCASEVRLNDGQVALVYGTSSGKLRMLSRGLTDIGVGSIQSVTITNPGKGYRQPPTITASGGHGAEFECGLNTDGQITGIVIKNPGTKYTNGSLTISAPPTGGVQATATFTVNNGGTQPVHWSFKSGCFEYASDSQDKKAGEQQSRHCSVTYRPTASQCLLNLKAYYNNAAYPRSNAVRRDRGTGFVHSDIVPAAILDMQATPLQEAESHGVARALFAGRALDDMLGTDRHVSIALSGTQSAAGQVAIHTLDVYGVNGKEGG